MSSHSQNQSVKLLLFRFRFWHSLWKDSETFYDHSCTSIILLFWNEILVIFQMRKICNEAWKSRLFSWDVRRSYIKRGRRKSATKISVMTRYLSRLRSIIRTEKAICVGPTRSNDSFDIFFMNLHLRISMSNVLLYVDNDMTPNILWNHPIILILSSLTLSLHSIFNSN